MPSGPPTTGVSEWGNPDVSSLRAAWYGFTTGGGGCHTISASVHGHTRASSCSHINLFILTSKLSIQKHLPVMAMLLHTVSHIGVHPTQHNPGSFSMASPALSYL